MKYRWNTKTLLSLLSKKATRKELDTLLYFLLDPLHLFDGEKISIKNTLLWDADYLSDNDFLFETINKSLPLSIGNDTIPEYKLSISHDETTELIHDFYKSLDKNTFLLFLKVFNKRFSHLRISTPICSSLYSGQTFACPTSNDVFISISSDKTFNDTQIGVHEYGHAISFLKNDFTFYDESKDFLSEVESIFFELLSLDYYDTIPDLQKESQTSRLIYINSLIDDINTLLLKMQISEILFDNMDGTFRSLYKKLDNELTIDKRSLKDISICSAQKMIPYVFSGIIALRLYSIYQNDPEYAMHLYYSILVLKKEDTIHYYEEIKNLGETPDKDITEFCRKLKR